MFRFQKNLVTIKLQLETDLELLHTEIASIAAASSADELATTTAMKTLQTEKDKLLADKKAQQLQNDAIILDLGNELLKQQNYGDDVNLTSPERNWIKEYQSETDIARNGIVQPSVSHATNEFQNIIPEPMNNEAVSCNNELLILNHKTDITDVAVVNVAFPVRPSQPLKKAIPDTAVYTLSNIFDSTAL